jgi:hypothetical protein
LLPYLSIASVVDWKKVLHDFHLLAVVADDDANGKNCAGNDSGADQKLLVLPSMFVTFFRSADAPPKITQTIF